jgi:hypothetical protein
VRICTCISYMLKERELELEGGTHVAGPLIKG